MKSATPTPSKFRRASHLAWLLPALTAAWAQVAPTPPAPPPGDETVRS